MSTNVNEQDSAATIKTANTETTTSNLTVEEERAEKLLKAKNLYSQGSRNFLLKSYFEAADELSQVCTIYEDIYGATSDELGMPYLLYAKSLIALAIDDNKIVDVPDEAEDDNESDADDEEADDAEEDEVEEQNNTNTDNKENEQQQKKDNDTKTSKQQDDSTKKIIRNHEEAVDSTESSEKIIEEKENENENNSTSTAIKTKKKLSQESEVSSTDGNNDDKKTLTNGDCNDEKQKTEAATVDSNDDDDKPSTSNGEGTAPTNEKEDEFDEEENEAASNLQLAWEILELAAKIFQRQGECGLPNLAEVHTELANIEYENSFFECAREDYVKALNIYNQLSKKYRREMAEIHYKIGLCYLMLELNKEGAASLEKSCQLIGEEIEDIKSKPVLSEKDKNNIKDMEETKQEIRAKITEIEETQAQNVAEVRAALDSYIKPKSKGDVDAGTSSSAVQTSVTDSGADISSSSAKPTDITHLIKRKKPDDNTSEAEAADSGTPVKRPAL